MCAALRIPIKDLRPGMFVEAGVLSVLVGSEIHHFLDLKGAAFQESKRRRLRLDERQYEQVSSAGGMLLSSPKQLAIFARLGATHLSIDTDQASVEPDQDGGELAVESLEDAGEVQDSVIETGGRHPTDRAIPEGPGHLEFSCLEGVPDDAPMAYSALKEALAGDSLTAVLTLTQPVAARLVTPGQELAVFRRLDENETDPSIGVTRPRAGPHVTAREHTYVAEVFGAVCIMDNEISVLPPVWVSPDRMQAHMIRLREVGPTASLTEERLRQMLGACGVCYGLVDEGLQQVLSDTSEPDTTTSVLLAQGKQEVSGDEAGTYLAFQRTRVAPGEVIASEGATPVREGELLAEVSTTGADQPAVDVTGKELTVPGRDQGAELRAGRNVRAEAHANKMHFYAAAAGRAQVIGGTLSVNLVSYVEDHVESSLRVDEGTDLHVRGSVRGAHIVAGGNVTVDGVIEGGSTVQIQGDVIVGRGIIGSQTRVVATRNIEARLVRGSSVVAMGDITVEGHLVNARVRARGKLIIRGHVGEDGSAIGGELSAGHSIEAKRISKAGAETSVRICPEASIAARIRKLDKALAFCRTNTRRIFRTLGVSEIEAANFKRIIESSQPEKRRPTIQLLRRLKGLVETRERSLQRRRKLEQEQELVYSEASILVTEHISANVTVHIGELSMVVPKDRAATVFSRNGDEIEARAP